MKRIIATVKAFSETYWGGLFIFTLGCCINALVLIWLAVQLGWI